LRYFIRLKGKKTSTTPAARAKQNNPIDPSRGLGATLRADLIKAKNEGAKKRRVLDGLFG
jgi:hypothetical protein